VLKTLFVRFTVSLWIGVLVLASTGCRDEAVGNQGKAEMLGSNVVATVRGEAVTTEDLEAVLRKIPAKKRKALRGKVLDNLIEARVFAEEARKKGLHEDPVVKEGLEKATKEVLARSFVKKRLDAEAEPSEAVLEKYYTDNQHLFVVPDAVFLQRTVFKDEQKAKEVLKLLKTGISLVALAKEEPVARSGKQRKPAWFYKGRMAPELEKTAFALEKDTLSDVIKTPQGYEIIKVLDSRDTKQFSFDEAKEKIRVRLTVTTRRPR
jgi:EpsD family peptidyl-prolyl cis-trans isomerase